MLAKGRLINVLLTIIFALMLIPHTNNIVLADSGEHGLNAQYFADKDLKDLKVTRIDPNIDFDWSSGPPAPSIPPYDFSARWYGKVEPKYSETYTFYTTTDDGVRLWVNGQLLIDKWVDQAPTEWSGSIQLQAGQKYDLIMEYYQAGGGAMAKLEWSSPSQPREVIPNESLYPENVTFPPIIRNIGYDDPTGLYIVRPGNPAKPKITLNVTNKSSDPITLTLDWKLLARGTDLISQGSYDIDLQGNEQKLVKVPLGKLTKPDYYRVQVKVLNDTGATLAQKEMGLGIIWPPHYGLRYYSHFGLGFTSEGDMNVQMQIGEKIGVKWTRGINSVDPPIVNPEPGVYWGNEEISKAREEILTWMSHGIYPLGYINYNMPWNVRPGPNGEQLPRHANCPNDMSAHANMVYHAIAPLHDLVKDWEIWNEPWVHGWTWTTCDAQDYRTMAKLIWDKVKKEFPDVNIIGGGSTTYNRDVVYCKGCLNNKYYGGYIDGSVNHAYGIPDAAQLAAIKTQATMDRIWSRTHGRAGLWQTELGTNEGYFPNLPEQERPYEVARTIAPTYLLHILGAGNLPIRIFWFALSYGADFSGGEYNIYDTETNTPKPAVVAYSAMTHFLEDSKLIKEIFPQSKSTWGFIFRRNDDGKATAALYLDQGFRGTIEIPNAQGLRIYDYLGTPLFDGKSNVARIQAEHWQVIYIVSEHTPKRLEQIIRNARFNIEDPLLVNPLSFTKPISQNSTIKVRVENASPNRVSAQVSIQAPSDWELTRNNKYTGVLQPGQVKILRFKATRAIPNTDNRYEITWNARITNVDSGYVTSQSGNQAVQVAYAPYHKIKVDGNLSDWQGIVPVTVDPDGEGGLGPDKVWTAWDKDYFYLAAQIPDQQQASNKPFDQDPYAFPFYADSIQMAFDVIKKNLPDDLLVGDPEYEKALASDMDHLFIATLAQGSVPELHRQTSPGTNYQTYYPTNPDTNPPLGPMDASPRGGTDGKIRIVRDETNKITTYEIAIAWKDISPLWQKLEHLRRGETITTHFAFAINDSGDQGRGMYYWTKEAGMVFSGGYNFAPFWGTGQKANGGRVITPWGFGR